MEKGQKEIFNLNFKDSNLQFYAISNSFNNKFL